MAFNIKHYTTFLTTSRKWMKMHRNREHRLKRVVDEELFDHMRLQSWFPESRERYWVVNESIGREHAHGARATSCDSREHRQGEHSQAEHRQGEHSQAEHRQGAMRA